MRINLLNAHMRSTIDMLAIVLIKTFTVSVLLSAVKCSTPGLCHLHSVLLSEVSLHAQTMNHAGSGDQQLRLRCQLTLALVRAVERVCPISPPSFPGALLAMVGASELEELHLPLQPRRAPPSSSSQFFCVPVCL